MFIPFFCDHNVKYYHVKQKLNILPNEMWQSKNRALYFKEVSFIKNNFNFHVTLSGKRANGRDDDDESDVVDGVVMVTV